MTTYSDRHRRYYQSPGAADRRAVRREANFALVEAAKTGPCLDCGRDDLPPEAMDLDHVPERGEKVFGVNRGTVGRRTRAVVQAEIAKCDRVCPTCHRLRTIARGQYG
jgi:5-methylcytosine-specific restriction endonuclease McrA